MAAGISALDSRTDTRDHVIAWSLLAALLALRLPFYAGIAYWVDPPPDWLSPAFEIGTYLFTAGLIIWERKNLRAFHIDGLALWIIILFKPLETVILAFWGFESSALALPNWPGLAIWAIALALTLVIVRAGVGKIRAKSLSWFGLGIAVGAITAVFLGYAHSFQVLPGQFDPRTELPALFTFTLVRFPQQLGYAAVMEEPLFRGFLWGYLRHLGWKDFWIWLFQAGLFILGHIYYLNGLLLSFLVIAPAGGLVVGLLAWRSRSIAASMAAHATLNALVPSLGLLFASFPR